LREPNLLMTKMDPPLAILGSLWFYMTPQPPKPAMHDIVLGNWKASDKDVQAGYKGPAFGPTSLVINNECGGEDAATPGGGGENRRIKAFKWFSKYFGFRVEDSKYLTCKTMQVKFSDQWWVPVSYAVDWSSLGMQQSCNCTPVTYYATIPFFAPGYYPQKFVDLNEPNRQLCVKGLYENPRANQLSGSETCMRYPPNGVQPAAPPPTTPSSAPLNDGHGSAGAADQCASPGLIYADPESCQSFYTCDGAKIPRKTTCDKGLVFNPTLQVCDWAVNVKCNVKSH